MASSCRSWHALWRGRHGHDHARRRLPFEVAAVSPPAASPRAPASPPLPRPLQPRVASPSPPVCRRLLDDAPHAQHRHGTLKSLVPNRPHVPIPHPVISVIQQVRHPHTDVSHLHRHRDARRPAAAAWTAHPPPVPHHPVPIHGRAFSVVQLHPATTPTMRRPSSPSARPPRPDTSPRAPSGPPTSGGYKRSPR